MVAYIFYASLRSFFTQFIQEGGESCIKWYTQLVLIFKNSTNVPIVVWSTIPRFENFMSEKCNVSWPLINATASLGRVNFPKQCNASGTQKILRVHETKCFKAKLLNRISVNRRKHSWVFPISWVGPISSRVVWKWKNLD